jgi:hypothetical protein
LKRTSINSNFETHKEKEMVSFRKWFPALAIVALLLGSAVAVSAQTSFTCQTVAGVPPLVRGEGLAELVGDVVLQCSGGTTTAAGAAVPGVNFSVFLNTNITSKVLNTDITEALLLIDEPVQGGLVFCPANTSCAILGTGAAGLVSNPPANSVPGPTYNGYVAGAVVPGGVNYKIGANGAVPNAFPGKLVQQFAGGTTVLQEYLSWTGVPLDAPGTVGIRTVRITNIRANANRIGVSSTLIPSQIRAFISITSTQAVSVTNPEQTVAFVSRGLGDFTVEAGPGEESPFFQCNGNSITNGVSFRARFTEGFSSAFKRLAQGGLTDAQVNGTGTAINYLAGTPPTTGQPRFISNGNLWIGGQPVVGPQDIPGQNTFTESGFIPPDDALNVGIYTADGVATNGTRLILRFANIPSGVTVYVGTVDAGAGDHPSGTASELWARARLISTLPDGSGTYTPIAAGTVSGAPWPVAALPASGIAVYEIVTSDAAVVEKIDIPVFVTFPANATALTPESAIPTVTGALAPLSTVRSEVYNGTGAPLPRFVDTPITQDAFVVNPCRTNILFPYITNQSGFDSGIAISNTTMDPYETIHQSGPCTINYYGNTTGGGAAPNAQTSTEEVAAGETLTFVVSSGGSHGITGTPGFQGYIIAVCDFQYGHGFAFITDGPIGAAQVAEGYLGLILDSPFSSGRTGYQSEALNQ